MQETINLALKLEYFCLVLMIIVSFISLILSFKIKEINNLRKLRKNSFPAFYTAFAIAFFSVLIIMAFGSDFFNIKLFVYLIALIIFGITGGKMYKKLKKEDEANFIFAKNKFFIDLFFSLMLFVLK